VHCDTMDTEYHGAAASSNNTDELTAIGKALTWLNLQPPSTTSRYEICSDSSYALDALDLADPPIECRSRTKPSSVGVLRDSKQFVARGTSCSSGRSRLTAQTNLSTLEETTAPTRLRSLPGEEIKTVISQRTSPTRL